LKDREFNRSNEIEDTISKVWDQATFSEVQSVFHNWMSHLAWVINKWGEYIIESMRSGFLPVVNLKVG
jgi:hypothetical protein